MKVVDCTLTPETISPTYVMIVKSRGLKGSVLYTHLILYQMDPMHSVTPYFPQILVILSSHPRLDHQVVCSLQVKKPKFYVNFSSFMHAAIIFFQTCLATMSVSRLYCVKWYISWRIGKDMECRRYNLTESLSRHLSGRPDENQENIGQDSRCPVRDSNWARHEYQSRELRLPEGVQWMLHVSPISFS
jgi:hypothetical protein